MQIEVLIISFEIFHFSCPNLSTSSVIENGSKNRRDSYENKKVVVPGKTLNEVSKILPGDMDKDVSIFFTDKHILFEFDDTVVVSRLIEGEYFKIDQMLSSDYETKVKINKKEFLNCIDSSFISIFKSITSIPPFVF